MRRRVIWGSLLALSLSANVYLWLTRPDARSSPRPTLSARPQQSLPRGLPKFEWEPRIARVPSGYASEDRAVLEQRLLETEARIDDLLPIDERYQLEERSSETEEKVRPYLDQVFEPLPGTHPKYQVECHGRVCKVESDLEIEWELPLQRLYPGREMFRNMQFGMEGVFIELDDGPVDGRHLLAGILRVAAATSNCGVRSASGLLRITFSFDASSRTIHVTTGGPLATQQVGLCFRKAIEETIARGVISPTLESVPSEPIELPLPL